MSTLLESIMLRILAESTDPANAKECATVILENQAIKRLMRTYVEKCIEIFDQNFPGDVDVSELDPLTLLPLIEENDRLTSLRRAILAVAERLFSMHTADPEETATMIGLFTESFDNIPGSMILGTHYEAVRSPDDVDGILYDRMHFFIAQLSYYELDDTSFFDVVQPILDANYTQEQ